MKLVEPSMAYDRQIQAYRRAFLPDLPMDGSGGLLRYARTEDWLRQVSCSKDPNTVRAGWVPATQFLCVREADQAVVGVLQLRHYLNDQLRNSAGHIGYSVAPDERRKGYATRMLALALALCPAYGIDQVLISCTPDNEGSRKTILKNGGIYYRTVYEPNFDRHLEQYRVDLPR